MTIPQVAVIGCGHWGKNLVRNFSQLGALQMVCDATGAGRELAAAVSPQTKVVARVDEVLNASIPSVIIATPAETHYELALRALQAGKDVLCEKPLALTYEQGAELVGLAEKRECILMVGHVLEYHPGIVRLLQMVHNGELGQLRYVYSNRLNLGKVRREENVLWSFAPHDIAIILRLMGAMPTRVDAYGGDYLCPKVVDVTVTHLLFDGGVRAHIHVSWLHPFKEQRLVVIGSRGMVNFDDVAKRLTFHNWREKAEIPFSAEEPLRLECQAFLSAIETRQPPLTDGASGLRVLKVLTAAQRSMEASA